MTHADDAARTTLGNLKGAVPATKEAGRGNQQVLEGWLELLYRRSVTVDVLALIEEVRAGDTRAYAAARKNGIHISRPERWQQVADRISEVVPLYA